MVKFIHGKEFIYFPEYNTISLPCLKSSRDLFSLLHELGHVACKHGLASYLYIEKKDVEKECKAWAYALRSIKPMYQADAQNMAIECINAYNSQCEISSGTWLIQNEIRELIESI